MSLSESQADQVRLAVEEAMGDSVTVETYAGDSGVGPVYAAVASVTCNVDATRRLVRNSDGAEVVSEFTLQVASDDADTFTPQSRITLATRVSTVLSVNPKTFNGLVVYAEVACS